MRVSVGEHLSVGMGVQGGSGAPGIGDSRPADSHHLTEENPPF